jgi:hypothetical protein
MSLVPVSRDQAFAFVNEHHRHHNAPLQWKFGVGVELDGRLIGVAIAGRPVARGLDTGRNIEVTRVCTLGTDEGGKNADSMLHGAIRRAAKALGYRKQYTYTLVSESGVSPRAAGYELDALVKGRSWDCPSRPRTDKHPTEDKYRWVIHLQKEPTEKAVAA